MIGGSPDCYDPDAFEVTARRTERQDAIAELIARTVIEHGVDFGTADVVAVHSETIGYRVLDALRDAGLTVTRRRSR